MRRTRPPRGFRTGALLTTAAAAAALLLGAVGCLPHPTVAVGAPADPANPLSASFTLANSGAIPLRDVRLAVGLCQMKFGALDPDYVCDGPLKTRLPLRGWRPHDLQPGERYGFRLQDALGLPAPPPHRLAADIAIVVRYRPWIWPLYSERQFKFFTRDTPAGAAGWVSKPVYGRAGRQTAYDAKPKLAKDVNGHILVAAAP